jgi:methylated-DNA-[protein]-cysteine S-methyltransferase
VPEQTFYSNVSSPVGDLVLVSRGGILTGVYLPSPQGGYPPEPEWRRDDAQLRTAREQLASYFAGELTTFHLKLAPMGTAFQRRVWDELCLIPFGATASYADIARRIGQPTATRAVGAANGRNPIAIIIPCHRVIGADGTLTGYGGGLECKSWLLRHEAAVLARRASQETLSLSSS